jgi:hypothetical protein
MQFSGPPMIGSAIQRDGVRKELPRIALNRQVLFYLVIYLYSSCFSLEVIILIRLVFVRNLINIFVFIIVSFVSLLCIFFSVYVCVCEHILKKKLRGNYLYTE